MTDYKIKGTAWYSGEDVLAEDVERVSSGVGDELLTHFKDMVVSFRMDDAITADIYNYAGIWHDSRDPSNYSYVNYSGINNYDFHITINTDTTLIDVGEVGVADGPSGVGYDTLGRRIAILTDKDWEPTGPTNNPPQSTGNIGVDLAEAGGSYGSGVALLNYIYIRWIEIRNPAVVSVHPIDGSSQYIGRENGYKILAVQGAGGQPDSYLPAHPDDIYIGYVTANGIGNPLTGQNDDNNNRYYLAVDARHIKARTPITVADRTVTYALNKIVTLEDHIRAVNDVTIVSNTNPHGSDTNGDHKVLATGLPGEVAGYLDAKVDGSTVQVNGSNQLVAFATGASDHKVKANLGDGAPNYLDSKVDDSTIYVNANVLKVKPGGITTTQIANNTIINANLSPGPDASALIRKGHLDNSGSVSSIAALVDTTNADALHYHAKTKAAIYNSTSAAPFANYATATGGGEELAFSVTVPTLAGQNITVIWYCLNGSGNPSPSTRASTIRLKITEGATALSHTVTTGATGTSVTPIVAIAMENILATTSGGTLIQCYTQYPGTVPGTGWSVVNDNRLSLIAITN